MKHLSKIAFEEKKKIWILVLTSVFIALTIVGQAYFFVAVVDRIFLQGGSFESILPLLAGLLLVLMGRSLFTWLNGHTGVKLASHAKQHFRKRLIRKYAENPVLSSLKGQSGRKVSVLMDAVDEVDGYYSRYIPQMIQTAIIPIIILVVVFTQHIYSGLIMIVTAPFIPFFMAIVGVMTKKKSEEQMEQLSAFSGKFLDTLQGLLTLKLFGRSKQQKDDIKSSSIGFRDATMEVLKVAFISSLMLEFISMLSIGIIALEIAIRLVVYESIGFFPAFFILILAPEFYLTLKEFGSAFHTGRGSSGAANQLVEELEGDGNKVEWGEALIENKEAPPQINLDKVSFSYGNEFSIKSITASIPPYSQAAIIGRSGAGKSTLLHLIAGIIKPGEGKIEVQGRNMFSYHEKEWFDQIGYISQDPYIFSGTIADNIAIGATVTYTDEEIARAAEKAGLASLIDTFEEGIHTFVGEGGRGLSGGEKQRLAIARVFLKKPSVILFDEPTTGLDLKTEQVLQDSLEKLSESATIITVAHRLHTIKKADRIFLIDKGELIASGTHEELLKQAQEYRDMVNVQQGGNSA
ncbi:thiol reductant ABC exporter subunit CydD [Halobacillus yeomjeoni]|uniref:Thiol reductant ABC exporter subunit CydD n=1 Tax=Halobacillus yeomjeoni TaxID=311194 RepID=A0A931HXK6_9BACI|nr:thiol reductant ABC exporter subunit CydD [Halobacillus yeomjeoni]MBH0231712.1 thiol reductant ABC exporter subunit CydD [Halobacillus yeomjeoni]